MVKKILRLGDSALYRPCAEILPEELDALRGIAEDLRDTLQDYRRRYGVGSMITAPQIGVPKRMFYINIMDEHTEDNHIFIINPIVHYPDPETYEVMDTCTSYPWLKVKTRRYRQCALRYRNLNWQVREVMLQSGLAALVQHGVDHLNGILGTQRAVDDKSLFFQPE
ncbi:peptide deformylase [Ruminococcaceae bacterium OttesenSCG-928-D13]|nr:peptide deformylase [Ruminococcaceae bacterium OttesenSCG-928-D13]